MDPYLLFLAFLIPATVGAVFIMAYWRMIDLLS